MADGEELAWANLIIGALGTLFTGMALLVTLNEVQTAQRQIRSLASQLSRQRQLLVVEQNLRAPGPLQARYLLDL